MSRAFLPLVVACLPVAMACGGEDHGGPAPTGPVVAHGGADGTGGAGGAAPVTTQRTVIQRNPFGNVAQADNLLWDGDFEWRSPFADQYGWLSGGSNFLSYALPALALAEACHSGLKCASIPPGNQIVGLALGSREAALAVSFWARGESGGCGDVVAIVTGFDGGPQYEVPAPSSSEAGGWCHFSALVTEAGGAPLLLIRNEGSEGLVVDDAVIAPIDTEGAALIPAPTTSLPEMDAIRAAAKKAIEPRRPPPSAAQEALEAYLKRRMRGRR